MLLPYPPSTNRLWRNAGGRMISSPEATAYKNQCGWLAKQAGVQLMQGPVQVALRLHPKATKGGNASRTRIDLDNAIKAALDALNGVAWTDDRQVVRLLAEVAAPMQDGGLSVEIAEALDSPGVVIEIRRAG